MAKTKSVTRGQIFKEITYDPATGVFRRIKYRSRGRGRIGTVNTDGYLQIRVAGVLCMAHRLAWMIVYGRWPVRLLDHKNRIRLDNWIFNLREVDDLGNAHNRGVQRNCKTGVPDVCWNATNGNWRARITFNGVRKELGSFDRLEDAVSARLAAERALAPVVMACLDGKWPASQGSPPAVSATKRRR